VPLRYQQELHLQGFLGVPVGKNPDDSNLACMEAMQWVFLYLSISHDRYYWEHLAQHGKNVPDLHHVCTTFLLFMPVVDLPVALADNVTRNLSSCL
jgi:hypothetical protein